MNSALSNSRWVRIVNACGEFPLAKRGSSLRLTCVGIHVGAYVGCQVCNERFAPALSILFDADHLLEGKGNAKKGKSNAKKQLKP